MCLRVTGITAPGPPVGRLGRDAVSLRQAEPHDRQNPMNRRQKKSRAGSPASKKTTKGGGEHPQMLHCIIWILRRAVNRFNEQNLLQSSEHKFM